MDSQSTKEPLDVLKDVLSRWPTRPLTFPYNEKALNTIKASIGKFVTDEFDYSIFLVEDNLSTSNISDGYIDDTVAKFLIYRHENDLPCLAILEQQQDGAWKLDILNFQCTSCFGEGVDNYRICEVCGGTGWGTLGKLEFRHR